jgi:peptide/nickel transport system substrate-binding protein
VNQPYVVTQFSKLATTIIALSTIVLMLAVSACSASGDEATVRERPLILGYASELQGLNPIVSTDQNANELIYYLLFTPLVTYDADFRPAPAMAESWVLSDSAVTFQLRNDLTWHDGTSVTSRDVAFTFERAKDPDSASPIAAAYLANVASVEILGEYEVRFHFSAPHSEPLEDFFWPPAPAHLLEDVPSSELLRAPFNRAPVGNGPYRFVRWDVNQQLVFTANPDYPPGLGGPPEIADVVYRIIPDQTTMLAELLSGGIQMDGPLAPSDAARIGNAENLQLLSFPWRQFAYVGWNTHRPQFADPAVRRALAMAIDRESLVLTVLEGHGTQASGPIPPWHRYAPDLAPLPHDVEQARALLEAAGWRDSDGDGIRERAGVKLSFELLANQRNPIYGDIAQIIQADLRAVGVEVFPRLLEWQTVLSMHRGRDFDAVLTNWVLDNFRVDPRSLFHGSQVAIANSANRSSYSNPIADSLMDVGSRSTDDDVAKEVWAEFSRVLQADQPVTFLFWQDELAGVSHDLAGVVMDARGELVTLPRWRWANGGLP